MRARFDEVDRFDPPVRPFENLAEIQRRRLQIRLQKCEIARRHSGQKPIALWRAAGASGSPNRRRRGSQSAACRRQVFARPMAIEIDAEDQILAKGTEPYRSVPVEPYQVLSRGKPRAPLSRSIDELSKRDRR